MPPRHPHHHPRHHRPSRSRVLEAVDLLRKSRKIVSVGDLIDCLKEMGELDLVDFLGEFQVARGGSAPDIDTAIAATRAYVLASARDEHDGMLNSYLARKIAMLFPLPPHIHEQFLDAANLTIMVAPGHRLPPHLRQMQAVTNPRECGRLLDKFDVIVFEGFQEEDGTLFVESGVAAILDTRVIPVATKLLVHLRPHLHDDDESLDLNGRRVTFI